MSVTSIQSSEASGAKTAFNSLEEEHWEVARSALKLAQAVEEVLEARGLVKDGLGQVITSLERGKLRRALLSFRAAASRVVV